MHLDEVVRCHKDGEEGNKGGGKQVNNRCGRMNGNMCKRAKRENANDRVGVEMRWNKGFLQQSDDLVRWRQCGDISFLNTCAAWERFLALKAELHSLANFQLKRNVYWHSYWSAAVKYPRAGDGSQANSFFWDCNFLPLFQSVFLSPNCDIKAFISCQEI